METYWMHEFEIVGQKVWDIFHVSSPFFHVKGLAEAKVTEDVKNEVVDPVRHVERSRPSGFWHFLGNDLAPSVYVGYYEWFRRLQCLVRKGVIQYTAFTSVNLDVDTIPSSQSIDIPRPYLVVQALFNVARRPEKSLVCGRSIDEDAIRSISKSWA